MALAFIRRGRRALFKFQSEVDFARLKDSDERASELHHQRELTEVTVGGNRHQSGGHRTTGGRISPSDGVPGAIGATAAKQRTLAARNDAHPAAFPDGFHRKIGLFPALLLFCAMGLPV